MGWKLYDRSWGVLLERSDCQGALKVVDIGVSYGNRRVIKGVSFSVKGGETYVLVGRNGSGKSTLLRAVAGLLEAEGKVLYSCEDYSSLPAWRRRFALFTSPFPLVRARSVRENMLISARLAGLSEKDAQGEVRRVALDFGIEHLLNRRPRELSMGERQKVGLATVVLSRPRALLVDEPFNHLTREWTLEVAKELRRAVRELGLPAVVATPRLDDAIVLGMELRAGVIYEGELIVESTVEELVHKPPHVAVIETLDVYSRNLLPLNDGLARSLGVRCEEDSTRAWIPPWMFDRDGTGGVEVELESYASGPLGITAVLRVAERKLEALMRDIGGKRLRVTVRGAICYDREGRRK
ncbi:MAG: ABC transporter ATP-binding protein [Acidilobaceae archaeon]|nr:ABC transporter ATP-binding protein [Acidilobaceae archaeon]MCX8165058.1 ABC transporter ATP-binding protein [Acidilobaceae archaeon]MDW7974425.1 ABC transporter ATP-binding protein [Sulfolobales archaeon]